MIVSLRCSIVSTTVELIQLVRALVLETKSIALTVSSLLVYFSLERVSFKMVGNKMLSKQGLILKLSLNSARNSLNDLTSCLLLACPCFGECYDGCEDCDNPICGGTNSCKNLELYLDYQVCKSIESEILGDCVTSCAGRFEIFSFSNYLP